MNIITIKDDFALISINNPSNNRIVKAIIDIEDIDKIKEYNWCVNNKGYAVARINNNMVLLHKLIMNYINTGIFDIDHRNNIRLDNRKVNLRKVTRSINCHNRANYKYSKGVYYEKSINKWRVRLVVDGVRMSIGCYGTFNAAKRVADEKIKLLNLN